MAPILAFLIVILLCPICLPIAAPVFSNIAYKSNMPWYYQIHASPGDHLEAFILCEDKFDSIPSIGLYQAGQPLFADVWRDFDLMINWSGDNADLPSS